MTDLLIRPAAPQDMEALADMVRHLARFHGDRPTVTPAALARDCLGRAPWLHVLLAERQGALCGYAMLCPRARVQMGERGMDLHHLYVQKDLRGQGIGRALVAESARLAARLGAAFLSVATLPENDAAADACLACGFRERRVDVRHFERRLEAGRG